MNEYLSVKEWAELHGRDVSNVRRMIADGRIQATKVGNQWIIPADTELPADRRIKSGKYRNWRKTREG